MFSLSQVRQATEKAREMSPTLMIEGPTQFDAAVDADVAAVKNKGKESQVLGKATVCVFPGASPAKTCSVSR